MIFHFFLFGLLALVGCEKYWAHSNDWENVLNWDLVPDACDAAILPYKDYDYSVLLTKNSRVNSLELPKSGELVFSERSTLAFSSLSDCLSPSRNSYRPLEYRWADPRNWESSSSGGGVFSPADSDRIPCRTDRVIFNESTAFNVIVDSNIEVGRLSIAGMSMTTETVRQFAGASAQLQITEAGGLSVSGSSVCTDPAGCVCGNALDCSQTRCPNLYCVKPLSSKGACCKYCGAEIRFKPPTGFYLEGFKAPLSEFLQDIISEKKARITVSMQEFESNEKFLQITVSDSNTDGSYEGAGYESSKIALSIYDFIVKRDIMRASDVIVELSHQPYPKEGQLEPEENTALPGGVQSWVLYAVLAVSVALLIVIVFLLIRCRNRANNANPPNGAPPLRMEGGTLPRPIDPRYKPCVPAMDADIPTYEEVLMEDMLTRGINPDQPRRAYTPISTTDTL